MSLIIVESPTKARTFNRILKGKDYYVFATLGHIRDLPSDKLSIDYTKKFKPQYAIIKKKERVVEQLKKLSQKNKEIILATDLDREGEAIAYHAAYLLGLVEEKWPEIFFKSNGKQLKRIVFHEITPKALTEALKKPGELRLDLIKAQQARRILDRIVGYELSPLLWLKMGKNWLSAGRVQTVALRLVVEREKEIAKFKIENYFQIFANFKNSEEFRAKLVSKKGQLYERKVKMQLFAGDYEYTITDLNQKNVKPTVEDLKADSYKISQIKEEIYNRYPPPPLTTSLMQQEMFNRYGYPSKLVMRLAQSLYEKGLITYHRTDSFNLSTAFVFAAKDFITETYGENYALEKPRGYRTKSRSAQEAHEAIRPTKVQRILQTIVKEKGLTKNHLNLYEVIFNRALATQMKEAQIKKMIINIVGDKEYLFEAQFDEVLFDGFLKVLKPRQDFYKKAPDIKEGEKLNLIDVHPEEKETLPPPRYTEASLIKILEERGIGRPSTYAPIISLIQDKGYVEREWRFFKPTYLGTAIRDYLSTSFARIFDIDFTATMEEGLDEIANGDRNMIELLENFYKPFIRELEERKKDKSKIEVKEQIDEKCPLCGNPLTIKFSRFGKFIGCSAYPKCKFTKPLLKFVTGRKCPLDGGRVVVRYTRAKRRFYGCENYPKCKYTEFVFAKLQVDK